MAAITALDMRLAKRNAAGNLITGTESTSFRGTEWDNIAAPRPVFWNPIWGGRDLATPDDVPDEWNVAIRGTEGEILCVQVNPDATFTADQADGAPRLTVKEVIYNKDGSVKLVHTRPLRNADRITPAGGAGITHRLGLADGRQLPAGEYSDYLRYAPAENAEWVQIVGPPFIDVHNNAV